MKHHNVLVEKRGSQVVIIFETDIPELLEVEPRVVARHRCNDDESGRTGVAAVTLG